MKRRQLLSAAAIGLATGALAKLAIAQPMPDIRWRDFAEGHLENLIDATSTCAYRSLARRNPHLLIRPSLS
jgi:hypothetical protein